MLKQILRILPLLFFFVCAAPIQAAIHIWTGAVNEQFSVAGNWSGGSPAGDANAQLSFPPGGRLIATNDIAGLTVRSISFSASGYQIGGNAIAFTADAELFDSTAGPNVLSCNLTLSSELSVYSTGSTIFEGAGITLAGAISGPGGLRLLGGGRLVLGGSTANTYTGVTRSLHGELQLRKPHGVVAVPGDLRIDTTFGNMEHGYLSTFANEQIADSATVTVDRYGTLAIGATERIGPLTLHRPSSIRTSIWWTDAYSGTIIFGGDITVIGDSSGEANGDGTFHLPASRTITFPAEGTSLFLQDVHGVAGAGLTLNADPDPGPGIEAEVDLRGNWNGPTVVNGGVVSIVNTQTAVTLQNGRFSGTAASLGATGGEVTGRYLSGVIASMGDVRLNAATTVALEIVGGSPVRVQLDGTLDLGSARLEILPSVYTPERQFGLSYTVIENASDQPVIGTFAGLPEGAIVDDRWRISYVGGTGNDVTLTESGHLPSSVGLGMSPSPVAGQPSTYTVTVYASPPIATPTGTATISKGDLLLATVSIANGTGSATMTLPKGVHDLTVRYGGNTLVAPSQVIQPVTVAPATPTITSVVPSSIPGNSTTTVTIHGSNFAPGAYVVVSNEASPANVISPTELTFTLRTPSYEGVLNLQVAYFQPSSVYSAPFPITVTSPLPEPTTKLTFATTSVSAPVAPGAMTAWVARGRRYSGYQVQWYNADGLVTDDDNDGRVTWPWPLTDQMPGSGIWVATDLTTGEIMAGSPYRTAIPRSAAFPADMFLRDPVGNFSHVIVPVDEVSLIQWSRPGVGAWRHHAVDGSAEDLDRVPDGRAVFNTSIMQPVGTSPPPPAGVLAGDRFVAITYDPEQWLWLGDSVDDHLGDTPGTATVSFPGIGFASALESEGVLRVFVLREHNSDGTATVDYATSPANPDPGVHYLDQAGQLTFGPGEVVKAIEIPLIDDALYSGPSTFTVTLSNPAGATLGPTTTANLKIDDDELPPGITLSVPASAALELDAGNQEVPVTVTLQSPAARSITMNWSWQEGSYGTPAHSGSLVFAPGETQKAFELTHASNTLPEPNRTITFGASWFPPNQEITEQGAFTIEDDDFARVSIQDAAVVEGQTVNLRLTLSEYSAKPVTVSYTMSSGNAGAGSDYVAQNGTLTITPPYTAGTLSIPTVDDAIAEGIERFTVTISSVEGGVLGNATAIVTIVDDDTATLGVPQALSAIGAGASVNVSWLPAANATAYEVYRATAGVPSTFVAKVTGTGFVDSTVTPNKAWVYRVLAVGASGAKSALSAPDHATTAAFDDDPLNSGSAAKSIHVEQLRNAINALREAASLPTVGFTFPVSAGSAIRASHLTQLRTALNEAREALGIAAILFTDATLTPGVTKLKAVHITELRQGCR